MSPEPTPTSIAALIPTPIYLPKVQIECSKCGIVGFVQPGEEVREWAAHFAERHSWATPADLRWLPPADVERIEGQKILSGRWLPITDKYWDTCVIAVRWRFRADDALGIARQSRAAGCADEP